MEVRVTAPVELKKSFTIPAFEMKEVWKKDGSGYTAGELITEILNRTTKAGLDVGGKDLQGLIKEQLMAELNKASDKIKNDVQKEVTKATNQLKEDATKSATDALKDAATGKAPADTAKDAGKTLQKDLGKLKVPFK